MKSFLILLVLIFSVKASSQVQDSRMFIFGNSLIDHRPPLNPTPSDETTVPHWIFLLSEAAGKTFAAGGQYGFLQQHANLPPFSQWGYDIVPGVWESDFLDFASADITTIMITTGNFIQYQSPSASYEDPNNNNGATPVSLTQDIIDWIAGNTESSNIYLYESWPDMAGVLGDGSFPTTPVGLAFYNEVTKGSYHDWWIEYQDLLLQTKPESNVRMIPVGPLIAEVYEQFLLGLPSTELYEDDAPHGRPSTYFLAALCSYMAIFEEKAPASFDVPEIINSRIADNYEGIVDYIWNYLKAFNDSNGKSRVFNNQPTFIQETFAESVQVFPNPASDFITVGKDFLNAKVTIYDISGKEVSSGMVDVSFSIDVSELKPGIYFGSIKDRATELHTNFKFIKILE
jgi:hypothetical protein